MTADNVYDVGIIGAGVAGAFAALRMAKNHSSTKTIIFDLGRPPGKRRRQLEGWLGCLPASDGKLYPGDADAIVNLVDGRKVRHSYNWIMEQLGHANNMKLLKDAGPSSAAQKRVKEAGFEIKLNSYIQWKPESIHQLSKIISDELDNANRVRLNFDEEVHKVSKNQDHFIISSASGQTICKKVILCVGRSGWRWANALYKELGLTVSDNLARYGIRAEISAQYMKDFNKSHCSLVNSDLEIGPLSWFGTVIPEDHADLVISAFRSNEERWKTDKVSFSVISSKTFQNQGIYQTDRLGKLAFLLFGDRVGKEKIKLLLNDESQLSLLPEYAWVKETLLELDKIIPYLTSRGSFHVPNILPLPSKINLNSHLESEVEGLFVAGENAGLPGILAAAISGSICADAVNR